MARNTPRTLTTDEARNVAFWSPVIFAAIDMGVPLPMFTYVKDNGEVTDRAGFTPVSVAGTDSTLSVVCESDNGARTFNIRGMQVAIPEEIWGQ
jgi:hypothetical protein